MNDNKRSKGITIFAWFFIITSAVAIIGATTLKGRLVTYESNNFILPASYYYVVLTYSIANAIVCLIIGIGLLKTLGWARSLVIIWALLTFPYEMMIFAVYTIKHTMPYFISTERALHFLYVKPLVALSWAIFIFYFFNRKTITVQFKDNIRI